MDNLAEIKKFLLLEQVKDNLNLIFPNEILTEETQDIKDGIFEQIANLHTLVFDVKTDIEDGGQEEETDETQEEEKVGNKTIEADNSEFEITNEIPEEPNPEAITEESIDSIAAKVNPASEAVGENKVEALLKFNIENFQKSIDYYSDGLLNKEQFLKVAARVLSKEDYKELYESQTAERDIEIAERALTYLIGKLGTF